MVQSWPTHAAKENHNEIYSIYCSLLLPPPPPTPPRQELSVMWPSPPRRRPPSPLTPHPKRCRLTSPGGVWEPLPRSLTSGSSETCPARGDGKVACQGSSRFLDLHEHKTRRAAELFRVKAECGKYNAWLVGSSGSTSGLLVVVVVQQQQIMT